MLPKQDIERLRAQSGDTSVFSHLLQNDPKFREGVEKVQAQNPSMSGFEKVKFPSAMLDIYYGTKRTPEPMTASMAVSSTQSVQPAPIEEEGAMDQLTSNPLGFAGETLSNVPGSAMNLVKGIGSAIAHPIQTGSTILKAGLGGAANTIETIADLAGMKNAEDLFHFESEEIASAIGDFYVQRYGSVEAAAMTLREDPVGFLSDVATVTTGVGGLIKGGATAAGAVTGAATKTATSLSRTGKLLRAAQGFGDDLVQAGIKMEPVVIAGKGVFMAGRGIRTAASAGGNAEKLIHSALKLQPNQMRNFMKANVGAGETPAGFLLRKGISGTREGIMDDLEKIATKSKATVDSELATVRETFDLLDDAPDVFKALTEIQDTAKAFGLEKELDFVNDLIKKERVSLTDINMVKREMDRLYRMYSRSNEPTASLNAERLRRIRDGLKTFIEDTAEQKGLKDIRMLNKDTQLSHALLDDLEMSMVGKFGNNIVSLGDFMTGGIGGAFVGYDPLLTAGIVVGRRVIGSTLFKTTLAKYLNRLSVDELKTLMKVMKGAKHTKESIRITRKVVAQTAEDMKQKRIGHVENALATLDAAAQLTPEGMQSPEGQPEQELGATLGETMPQEESQVNTPIA